MDLADIDCVVRQRCVRHWDMSMFGEFDRHKLRVFYCLVDWNRYWLTKYQCNMLAFNSRSRWSDWYVAEVTLVLSWILLKQQEKQGKLKSTIMYLLYSSLHDRKSVINLWQDWKMIIFTVLYLQISAWQIRSSNLSILVIGRGFCLNIIRLHHPS